MKKLVTLVTVLTVLAMLFLPMASTAAEDTWNPADGSWTKVDDCADPSKAFAINPAINWQVQAITTESDYWGEILGNMNLFMNMNKSIANSYFIYECKPGAAVALKTVYEGQDLTDETVKAGREIKVYTSEDLTSWTQVTGDNLKYKFGGNPADGNGAMKSIYYGVGAVPADHRYVKFLIPTVGENEGNVFVDDFLAKGGTDYAGHEKDAYYLHDDMTDIWAHTFAIGGSNDPGWVQWTQPDQAASTAANHIPGTNTARPNSYREGNYLAYRVAPGSRVVFQCSQSVFANEWVDTGIDWLTWVYDAGTYDQNWGFTIEKSKDGLAWEKADFTRESYPYWCGGFAAGDDGTPPNTWNDWFCQGYDRVYLGADLGADYQYVRLVFPKEAEEFSHVPDLYTQAWDVDVVGMTAYSDTANTPAPSTVPALTDTRVDKYFEFLIDAEEGNQLVILANLTYAEFKDIFSIDAPYTMKVLNKYDDEVEDSDGLVTGMKINVYLGDMLLATYIVNNEDAEEELSAILKVLNATPTTPPTQTNDTTEAPSNGAPTGVTPLPAGIAAVLLAAAAALWASKRSKRAA